MILKSNKDPILAFFAVNHEEVMTSRDIAQKFGMYQANADRALKSLCRDGWVEVEEGKRPRMWAAGPKLRELIKEQ